MSSIVEPVLIEGDWSKIWDGMIDDLETLGYKQEPLTRQDQPEPRIFRTKDTWVGSDPLSMSKTT